MRAIDTNIIVRFLTNDHHDQSLRGAYQFSKPEIAAKLMEVVGLPGMSVEDPEILAEAIAGLRAGMDFADALHLAIAGHCESMLSFDTDFAKRANELGTIPVLEP